ncbi:MAG: glycine betaine ABC transporter substrate-binding protein [Lachnospiraceae bacterium]
MINDMVTLFMERKEFFLSLLLEHLQISLIAILLAIGIGGMVGILISEYQQTARPTLGVINFLYTIPSISMLGFLIPFSGIGNATAIIALTIYALLPMVRNTHTGLSNVDERIIEAATGMGSTRLQTLFRIRLPLAIPVIMSGIRNMVTMTIALAGIASFIGAGGLGVAIYRGITTNNTAMTMVGSLLIAALALLMDFLLGQLEKRMKKRGATAKGMNYALSVAAAVLCLVILAVSIFRTQTKDTIHIATKPMTEQYILGEMLNILIEQETDLNVELTEGVGGGTSNIQPAMEKGEFDLYPEYTGTGWNMVLKNEGLYSEDLFGQLQTEYESRYQMQWIGTYGFNNTFGIAVRKEIAEKYDIKTYSDLNAVAGDLIFGAEYDFFEREDGYNALCEAYGLTFKEPMDMDIGLKYQAINEGQIDVMNIFTTDGQSSISDIVILEDDKNFYPSYLCANVVRSEVLTKYPELVNVLHSLEGIISDDQMAKMNYKVESQGIEPEETAREFLQQSGLLKQEVD